MMLTMFIIMSLSFWIIRLMPQSIFENPEVAPEIQKLLEAEMHLDKPMWVQYYYFIRDIITERDFGASVKLRPGMDVFKVIATRIKPSMVLNFFSLLLSIPAGIILGTIAALQRNKWADNLISFLVVIFISVPSFVFGRCSSTRSL